MRQENYAIVYKEVCVVSALKTLQDDFNHRHTSLGNSGNIPIYQQPFCIGNIFSCISSLSPS